MLLMISAVIISFAARPNIHPFNLNFEEGLTEKEPPGWTMVKEHSKAGYFHYCIDYKPYNGDFCLLLGTSDSEFSSENAFGSAYQVIEAGRYANQTIRFSAYARLEKIRESAVGYLWVQEYLQDGSRGRYFQDTLNKINTEEWKKYSIDFKISPTASRINYGFSLKSVGSLYADDCTIEVISNQITKKQAQRELNDIESQNLFHWAKVYGLLKLYHPSDASYINDWESFAYHQIKELLTKNQLLAFDWYQSQFDWLCKSCNFTNTPSKIPSPQLPNYKKLYDYESLSYVHTGIANNRPMHLYNTRLENTLFPQKSREAAVYQVIDVSGLAGKFVKFSAFVKTNLIGLESYSQLWMRLDLTENAREEDQNIIMLEEPIRSNEWAEYSSELLLPDTCKFLRLGLVLVGDGKAWFDEIKVSVSDSDGRSITAPIANPTFELDRQGGEPKNWTTPYSVKNAGYKVYADGKNNPKGKFSLAIESDASNRVEMPMPNEHYQAKINNSFYLTFPINIFGLRTREAEKIDESKLPEPIWLDGDDMYSRLAIFIELWNTIRNTGVNPNSIDICDNSFQKFANKSAIAKDKDEFLLVLNEFMAQFGDGLTRLWSGYDVPSHALPILWKLIDGNVVVTKVHNSIGEVIQQGDVVLKINGIDARKLIDTKSASTIGNDNLKLAKILAEIRTGFPNESVTITVQSKTGGISDLDLKKNIRFRDLQESRPAAVDFWNEDIAYVDFTRIDDEQMKYIIDTLKTAKGIVLDLRGQSLISEFALGLFLDEDVMSIKWQNPVYPKPERTGMSFKNIQSRIKSINVSLTKNIAIITDEKTSGYTESMAHLARRYDIGKIVGKETAGAPGEIAAISLPRDYFMTLNHLIGELPNGESIFQKSIVPDILVQDSEFLQYENADPFIIKAIEYLETKIKKDQK